MSKIKILHCADIHIGAELSSIGNKARQRKEEILMTFDNIVSICKDENIKLLLIAGDLFQSSNMDNDIIRDVKKSLKNIPDTIVAIAPGNHDYIAIDSPFLNEDWPDNVHIFKSKLSAIEFKELGVRVWGAGFTSTYVTSPLLDVVDVPSDDMINICVIHGDLISENQTSKYNPISLTQIRFSDMDYIALGHIHKRSQVLKAKNTYYSYCGCPEGQGFDELGEKGVYIGTIAKGNCDLEFRPICKRMNVELDVDISGAHTNNEVAEIVFKTIEIKYGKLYSKHLYKIILEGALDANFRLDFEAVGIRLENKVYFIKFCDETHIEIDINTLAKEASLKGIFVRKIIDKINKSIDSGNDVSVQQYRKALYIGLKAFDGEVGYNEN